MRMPVVVPFGFLGWAHTLKRKTAVFPLCAVLAWRKNEDFLAEQMFGKNTQVSFWSCWLSQEKQQEKKILKEKS